MEDKVREIWENFDNQLRGFICTKMNNNDECLDVLQDVYLKIIRNIDKISSIENIPSYLNRIASNTIVDHYRAKSKKPAVNDEEQISNIVIVDEVDDNNEQLNECCLQCLEPGIEALPEIYKEAIILTDVKGMPQKEFADKLGISISGAKSRVQRAREKLKDEVLKCTKLC